MQRLHDLWTYIRAHIEIASLVILGVAISLFWLLAELVEEVVEGSTTALDRDILLLLRNAGDLSDPIGPWWLEEMGRDLTALGGVAVLTLLTVVVGVYFALRMRFAQALYLWVAVGGGILLSSFAKNFFDRARPDLVPHGSLVHTSSFPSGHSMMAAVCYLTLGVLLARAQPSARMRFYVMTVAILMTLLVGISRVYLGVHWPTDVAAGWLGGAFWAVLCYMGTRLISWRSAVRRGRMGEGVEG
ncbi:phosphatase PAP2 family protein [Thalassorhabdomicrobium marinisediminis]|uniref:phosphatase PAP2 family protein n=1 Tax=Thalassorhabdomicrobium marinisediminis TaxID=2170577 RepID=UPI002491D495|nr:phosphatase PAP2 family protein [Thalassorhabdomicrobium marinisediminis]